MKCKIIPFFILLVFSACNSTAQKTPNLQGAWKGSSICQVKNSPCHDEIAVYHISQINGSDSFNIQMNKIVNNKEEEMSLLKFIYDPKDKALISKDTAHDAIWTLKPVGDKLEGTLLYKGQLYRIIQLTKQD